MPALAWLCRPVFKTQKFWDKVEKTPSCWLWVKAKKQDGYGLFRTGNRLALAHRVSWELHNGPIPDGMFVCHRCDNPGCVNPDHLFLATHRENMLDMRLKGRSGKGVERPHRRRGNDASLYR